MTTVIPVPVKDGVVVDLAVDSLPEAADVVGLLKEARATAETWLAVAVAYVRMHGTERPEQHETVATEGLSFLPQLADLPNAAEADARRALCNLLAASLIARAAAAPGGPVREDLLKRAISHINAAESTHLSATWVNRGFVMLLEGRGLERAQEQFAFVLSSLDKNSGAAMAGEALVLFQQRRYTEALARFRAALRAAPASAAVRYGIAACATRLARHAPLAAAALARAQALAPSAVAPVALEAVVASGILALNANSSGQQQLTIQTMVSAMENARRRSPAVLARLADHAFFRGDIARSLALAQAARDAYAHAQDADAHAAAEASFLVGRAYHAQGMLDAAQQHYSIATMSWKGYPLAQFGLAQLHIARNELDHAATSLDAVLQAVPDSVDALCLLASVSARIPARRDSAIELCQRVSKLRPGDPQPWLDLARITQAVDATTALAYYGSAIDALEAAGQSVPQEVWNNVGVLQLDNGKLDEAERSLLRAVEAGGANLSQFAERNVTVTFNLARVYEARHDDLHAEELYKGILLEHPNYTDCYLRLAAMARARGAAGDASEWAKEVLQLDADHPGAIAMLASLHFDREDWAKAQKQFERLQQVAPNDGYSHVALGNIFYNARFRDGGNAKADKYLKAACERYLSALKADPANVYAANGLGIVFAEHSDIAAAREAFVQVRDATVDVPDVWVNLGHVYMLQGQYASAAKMYDTALLRNSGSNSLDSCALLLFHANALFEQHNFSECQRALQLAVRECPQCLILWYDLAVCCEEACVAALHADKEPQRYTRPQERVAAMQMALSEAKTAASIFAWLSTAKPAPHSVGGVQYKHSQGRASRHADRCRNLTEKARVAWSVAQELERQDADRRREDDRKLAEQREQQRKAEAEALATKQAEELRLQELAQEQLKMQTALSEALAEDMRKMAAESERRRGRSSTVHPDDLLQPVDVVDSADATVAAAAPETDEPQQQLEDEEDKKRTVARALEKIRAMSKRSRNEAEAVIPNESVAASASADGDESPHKKKKHHRHHHKHHAEKETTDTVTAPKKEHKRLRKSGAPERTPSPPPPPPTTTTAAATDPQEISVEMPSEPQPQQQQTSAADPKPELPPAPQP